MTAWKDGISHKRLSVKILAFYFIIVSTLSCVSSTCPTQINYFLPLSITLLLTTPQIVQYNLKNKIKLTTYCLQT